MTILSRFAPLPTTSAWALFVCLSAGCAAPKEEPKAVIPAYEPPTQMPAFSAEELTEGSEAKSEAAPETTPAAAPAKAGPTVTAALPGATPRDLVIAKVNGEPVYMSNLMQRWMMSDSRLALEHFRDLVEERIVMFEAKRMGVSLNPAAVDDAVIDVRAKIEADLEENQPGLGFDDYFRRYRNMSPENYVAGIRRAQIRGMLLERVARTWLLTQEHVGVRIIIVRTEELGTAVQAALDAGRTFEEVAVEFSEDVSRENGGLLPPVVRGDQTLLSRIAFSNAEGTVTGPVENGTDLVWVQVLDSPKPLTANWDVVESLVEADLQRRPLDDYEFLQWKSSISVNYETDAEVFLNLIGEAPKGP
ncbi:MAG: parvulin-like peptidyl-prolyl isomerase [Planctomycetota bacterium]|jgi:parvulin-like peptidyl-prolyl isomerase